MVLVSLHQIMISFDKRSTAFRHDMARYGARAPTQRHTMNRSFPLFIRLSDSCTSAEPYYRFASAVVVCIKFFGKRKRGRENISLDFSCYTLHHKKKKKNE